MPSAITVHLPKRLAWLNVHSLERSARALDTGRDASSLRRLAKYMRAALEKAGIPEPAPVIELMDMGEGW